jgi:membrane-bound lytic murein transglycosylase D
VRHTLKPGETLEIIAKQYQVPARNILQWNKISSLSKIKKGQQLALHLDRPTPEIAAVKPQISQAVVKIAAEIKQTAQVPTLDATKKRSATKSQPETVTAKQSVAAAKKELPPTWYVVKNGDTLTTIARKFQASPQNIRAWNKLSNNTLQTGNKLIIKKG